MALMKTQADHRMAVLQGNRLNMDDAMDDVCLTGGVVLRGGSHHFTYDSPSAIYNIQLLPSYEVNIESCQPWGGGFPQGFSTRENNPSRFDNLMYRKDNYGTRPKKKLTDFKHTSCCLGL